MGLATNIVNLSLRLLGAIAMPCSIAFSLAGKDHAPKGIQSEQVVFRHQRK